MNILYEDKYIIAVEKPAGILAFPIPGSTEKTIGDMVGALPCHRLDRDTSGIMLLAKSEEVKLAMQKLFKDRNIRKEYIALVWGKVEPDKGEIKIPLGRGTKDRMRIVPDAEGRESHTIYSVRRYYPKSDMSLLSVEIKTGRTHQIRVHFSSIGHPVVGDKEYSRKLAELSRQFLHAESISFNHPYTKKRINLTLKLPKELKDYLKTLS